MSRKRTIGLVGCVATKLDKPSKAKDLYISPLFRGRRRYVEKSCNEWFVLSALHGLVDPEEVIAPYNVTLKTFSSSLKHQWSSRILSELNRRFNDYQNLVFEVHAGSDYRDFGLTSELVELGAQVRVPAYGLSQGRQLQFYGVSHSPVPSASRWLTSSQADNGVELRFGSYGPLAAYLESADKTPLRLTFGDVEKILGRSIPMSARTYRAWWSNEIDGTHSHAKSWMSVGWKVDQVDFNAGSVIFRRVK